MNKNPHILITSDLVIQQKMQNCFWAETGCNWFETDKDGNVVPSQFKTEKGQYVINIDAFNKHFNRLSEAMKSFLKNDIEKGVLANLFTDAEKCTEVKRLSEIKN